MTAIGTAPVTTWSTLRCAPRRTAWRTTLRATQAVATCSTIPRYVFTWESRSWWQQKGYIHCGHSWCITNRHHYRSGDVPCRSVVHKNSQILCAQVCTQIKMKRYSQPCP